MSGGTTGARIADVRHDAVNILLRYLHAVDDQDLSGVLAALGEASVSFGGPAQQGARALSTLYRAAFATGGRTRHLLHEALVEESGEPDRVLVRAAYQRWSLDDDPPTLTAIGRYTAELDVRGPTRLVVLTVIRDWALPTTPPPAVEN